MSNQLISATNKAPSPAPLMQLITGFWAAKTLASAVELDLFDKAEKSGGLSREDASRVLQIQDRPADLLLAACASLGLLQKEGEIYVNTPLSREFLIPGQPYYFGGFVRMLDHREYPAWQDVSRALRENRPTTWDPAVQPGLFHGEDPVLLSLFWEAMHSLSMSTGRELASILPDFALRTRLLDVGGGSGAISIELCRAFPELRATVYDLPFVRETATDKAHEAGLSERIDFVSGNFLEDKALPAGYDTIMVSSIMHDWDEKTDREILAKCFEALPPGGLIIISEILLNDERTGPPEAALMGMNMLVETAGGKNYSGSEYRLWLTETGFTDVEMISCQAVGTNGVIIAYKP
ncbi:methyltransferase [Amycolatopsis sp. lyj-90]|uniref:methyltransferase n=1 Tax=Amycolatopsis sp. lyj-90 TaxID=2789285 RepID=UPI00397BA410